MYYDLYIDHQFQDYSELEDVDAKGFCLVSQNNKNTEVLPIQTASKPIYTRLNVEYSNRLDTSSFTSFRHHDIVCIKNVGTGNLPSVIKLEPDLINLKIDEIRHIKKSFINILKEKRLYVEICTRDALYNTKERILWMNSLRRLLKLGCAKILVVSSGAQVFTELKHSNDICKMLKAFGLSDDRVRQILNNSEQVLRNAALKRYSTRNCIYTNENEGRLKEDFIINYQACQDEAN